MKRKGGRTTSGQARCSGSLAEAVEKALDRVDSCSEQSEWGDVIEVAPRNV